MNYQVLFLDVIPGNISYPRGKADYGFEFWNELNYTLYPYDGTMPSRLPIWYDESSLIGSLTGRHAIERMTIMQNSLESEFVADKLKETPPKVMNIDGFFPY